MSVKAEANNSPAFFAPSVLGCKESVHGTSQLAVSMTKALFTLFMTDLMVSACTPQKGMR